MKQIIKTEKHVSSPNCKRLQYENLNKNSSMINFFVISKTICNLLTESKAEKKKSNKLFDLIQCIAHLIFCGNLSQKKILP